MATLIPLTDLTNQTVTRDASGSIDDIEGIGTFEKILASTSSFLELQEQNNKITQAQYAEVLTQSLPVVLNASIDFLLKSLVTASEIDKSAEQILGIRKDNQLKDQQILESEFKMDFMYPAELSKINAEISGIQKDNQVKDQQILESTFNVQFVQPKQLEKITAEILGMAKDNELKSQQILESKFKMDFMYPAELLKINAEVAIAQAEVLIKNKEVEIRTAELAMAAKELLIKTAQLDIMTREIALKEAESVSNTAYTVQRTLTEVQNTTKTAEEKQLMHVTRIAKDKESALMGLDDVALKARMAQDGTTVYSPSYTI